MSDLQYKSTVHDIFVRLQKYDQHAYFCRHLGNMQPYSKNVYISRYCEKRHTNIKTVFKVMGSRNKVKGEAGLSYFSMQHAVITAFFL